MFSSKFNTKFFNSNVLTHSLKHSHNIKKDSNNYFTSNFAKISLSNSLHYTDIMCVGLVYKFSIHMNNSHSLKALLPTVLQMLEGSVLQVRVIPSFLLCMLWFKSWNKHLLIYNLTFFVRSHGTQGLIQALYSKSIYSVWIQVTISVPGIKLS